MIEKIVKLLVQLPVYPHWLNAIKMEQGNKHMLSMLQGAVIEVGAGDGARKNKILAEYKKITSYIATDFSSWDSEFNKYNNISNKYDKAGETIAGFKKRIALDEICSATDLPFSDESFDAHISFEVLEHIDEPKKYFSEAVRVVRKEGYIVLSVPFLYRMHGGEPDHKMDYARYANGFFYKIVADNNIQLMEIFHNTGAGTTIAQIANQYIIRKVAESYLPVKIIFLIFSPFIFLFGNIFGYIIDLWPDKRFATRFHVIFKK